MGRNEIRLRRQKPSSGNLARYRNYAKLMARHERNQRWQRTLRALIYVVIVVVLMILMILFFLVKNLENIQKNKTPEPKNAVEAKAPDKDV